MHPLDQIRFISPSPLIIPAGVSWNDLKEAHSQSVAVAEAFRYLVFNHVEVTSLDLSWKKIGSHGATLLAIALTSNSTLKHINLSMNPISMNPITDESPAHIATALSSNSTLLSLNLRGCLRTEDAIPIIDALTFNSTLTELNLGATQIENRGIARIANALDSNTTLTSLGLDCCYCDGEEAALMAGILTTNSTLTTLNWSHNALSEGSIAPMTKALTSNSTLTSLSLMRCNIGYTGAALIAKTLAINSTLTFLDLSRNPWTGEQNDLIADALNLHPALISLGDDYRKDNTELQVIFARNKANALSKAASLFWLLSQALKPTIEENLLTLYPSASSTSYSE